MLFENFSHGISLLDISQNDAAMQNFKKKKNNNMLCLFSLIKSYIVK